MAGYHVVKQGEHLSGIAEAYGFHSYKKIWNHPRNADLKAQRHNPNVLFPGDKVFIPDREEKSYDIPTDNQYRFELSGERLFLKINIERGFAQPMAQTPCELIIDANKFEITSDGSGLVQHEISKSAVEATLSVRDKIIVHKIEVALDLKLPIKIGYLDPVEEVSGQQARLSNLGYYRGAPDTIDEEEMISAIEEFQCGKQFAR